MVPSIRLRSRAAAAKYLSRDTPGSRVHQAGSNVYKNAPLITSGRYSSIFCAASCMRVPANNESVTALEASLRISLSIWRTSPSLHDPTSRSMVFEIVTAYSSIRSR